MRRWFFRKDRSVPSPALQEAFLEVVDNQIRDNDPPETKETFERLLADGYPELDARKLIAGCVACEVHRILQTQTVFDQDRYVRMLADLPDKLPFGHGEEEEEGPAMAPRRRARPLVGLAPQPPEREDAQLRHKRPEERFPASVPRRMFWSDEVGGLSRCPECGARLVNEYHAYLLAVRAGGEMDSFITGGDEGYFCPQCPTVVLDREIVAQKARYARVGPGAQYLVMGIVDLDAVPPDKAHVPVGEDDNPVPLVKFTNLGERRTPSSAVPRSSAGTRRREANQRKRDRKRRRK